MRKIAKLASPIAIETRSMSKGSLGADQGRVNKRAPRLKML
jgi:hypothetical protein